VQRYKNTVSIKKVVKKNGFFISLTYICLSKTNLKKFKMENLETPNNDQINPGNPFDAVPTVSLGKNALNYGLILGGISVVYTILLWVMGQFMNKPLGYIGMLFTIGVMFYGTKDYRDKHLGGFMSYGKAFSSNFLIGLYSTIIGTIFAFVLFKYLDPKMIETIKETAIETAMQKNPNLTQEQLEGTMSFVMSPVFFTLSAFIGGAFLDAILALIMAIFHKKELPLM
jgi:hypothetical protein